MKSGLKGQRLVAAFLFGCLALNYPVLSLFNSDSTVFGIPLLYVYIFGIWTVLIVVMAIFVEMPD